MFYSAHHILRFSEVSNTPLTTHSFNKAVTKHWALTPLQLINLYTSLGARRDYKVVCMCVQWWLSWFCLRLIRLLLKGAPIDSLLLTFSASPRCPWPWLHSSRNDAETSPSWRKGNRRGPLTLTVSLSLSELASELWSTQDTQHVFYHKTRTNTAYQKY